MRIDNTDLIAYSKVSSTNLASSMTSSAIQLDHIYGYSLYIKWTGTPTGTFKLQVSNDAVTDGSLVSNWEDLTGSSLAVAGAAGSNMYNVSVSFYRFVRLVYTASSGSGTLTACNLVIKGI